jgi:hypothetical protein
VWGCWPVITSLPDARQLRRDPYIVIIQSIQLDSPHNHTWLYNNPLVGTRAFRAHVNPSRFCCVIFSAPLLSDQHILGRCSLVAFSRRPMRRDFFVIDTQPQPTVRSTHDSAISPLTVGRCMGPTNVRCSVTTWPAQTRYPVLTFISCNAFGRPSILCDQSVR